MGTARRQAIGDGLVVYSAACKALAAARTTDEVSRIRNQAAALRAYAKQAKNRQLEIDAVEIRIRAERRVGELMDGQRKGTGLSRGGRPKKTGCEPDPVLSVATLADAGIDKQLADRGRKLAAVPEKRFESMVSDWRDRASHDEARVTVDLLRSKTAVHHSSETPEHYTPAVILEAVVACFDEIDLDPCSNPGDPNVCARRVFTKDDDGLAQPWTGRVYMNPPYGREIDAWIEKLCAEFARGDMQAIALLPARTDTQWFARLRDHPCCLITGRLTFIGNTDPAPFPSAVFYLGDDLGRFHYCFAGLGDIWQRLDERYSFGD